MSQRILVVDDMQVFREPIAAALKLAGYETDCAEDGQQALALARRHRPDLVLLDVAMPKMDGLDFLKAARSDDNLRRVPVILLTAVAEKQYVIKAGRYGISDYLLKSQFSTDELQNRVKRALGDRENQTAPPTQSVVPDADNKDVDGRAPAVPAATQPDPGAGGDAIDGNGTTSPKPQKRRPVAPVKINFDDVHSIKDLKPVLSRAEIQERLEACGELKGLSPTVAQIQKMTRSPDCSVEAVAKIIKHDHAIALKILQLANSAIYTRGEPLDSVQKAVMRLGLSETRQVVLNISVIESFSSEEQNKHLNIPLFWEHAISCGLIAAEITRFLEGTDSQADAAFTMGLLHDVGRVVYVDVLPDYYDAVVAAAKQLHLPLEQVESRMLLINHADAMDRLLNRWGFAKELVNPIAFHHLSIGNMRRACPSGLTEVAVLGMANRLAHAMLLGSSGNDVIYPTEEFAATLKLRGDVIGHIVETIPAQANDIKLAMLSMANEDDWSQMDEQVRNQLEVPFRPLYVSDNPELDAYRVFCEQLQEPADDEAPNICVVHLSNERDAAKLAEKFAEAEQAAQVNQLPVIVLSPKGDVTLEGQLSSGLRVKPLATPTSVASFVAAANGLLGGQESTEPADQAA